MATDSLSGSQTGAPFYLPVVFKNGDTQTATVAPSVTSLPSVEGNYYNVVIIPHDLGATYLQGLYVLFNDRWRLAMPMVNLSKVIVDGGVVTVYVNQTAEVTVPDGAEVFKNGIEVNDTTIPANDNIVYLTYKPTHAGGAGSGDVTSVNGVSPDSEGNVALVATNIPGFSTVARSGNYDDLENKPTLGTAAAQDSTAFATAAQGTKADSAVQPDSLATVATSGDYNDLQNLPTIPPAQVSSDWNADSGVAQILNKPTLGTAAAADTTDFATAAQGTKADSAVQPGDLATVATSGSYNDLSDRPTLGTAAAEDTTAFATAAQGTKADTAVQPDSLATVATSGSYDDLSDKPTIPPAYTLPAATDSDLGGVKIGSGINVEADGTISVTNPLTTQPQSALPDLEGPPDEAWVNNVLKPMLVAAGILEAP